MKSARILILVLTASLVGLPFVVVAQSLSDSGWFADAHIHHGLAYKDDELQAQYLDYYTERAIRIIGFPMPIRRDSHQALLPVMASEIGDLRSLSSRTGTLRIADDRDFLTDENEEDHILIVPGIEYFYGVFGGIPESVLKYNELGIRYITLIDNEHDRLFVDGRLSQFGQSIISQMNETGIVIDISHLSEIEAIQVIELSRDPVVASHSCANAVSGTASSLRDPVLDTLANHGGYVFITFNENDLYRETELDGDGVGRFVDHVTYLVGKLGHGHVGIGSDYQAMGRYVPKSLNETDSFEEILITLRAVDFSEEDIEKLQRGAFLDAFDLRIP